MSKLTFGIELEFICVYPQKTFLDIVDSYGASIERPASRIVRQFLDTFHVPVQPDDQDDSDLSDEDCDIFAERDAAGPGPAQFDMPEDKTGHLSYWSVKEDTSVALTTAERTQLPAGYRQEAVELSSPKYHLSRPDDFTTQLLNLTKALQALEVETNCYILTNESCGFHVHIGNGNERLPFHAVKRVMQLTLAHERNFDALHAAGRITYPSHPSGLRAAYEPISTPSFAPLSFFLRRSAHHTGAESLGFADYRASPQQQDRQTSLNIIDPFAMLARIEQASDYRDIGRFFEVRWESNDLTGHSSAINFDQMYEDRDAHRYENELYKTIEFRKHAGTLDRERIVDYVEVLIRVVEYCTSASDEDFLFLLLQGADTQFNLLHLLQALNANNPHLIESYRREHQPDHFLFPSTVQAYRTDRNPRSVLTENLAKHYFANDRSVIADKIDEKLRGYYGWDPLAGSMPMTREQIAHLLVATCEVSLTKTQARTLVFGSFSRIYCGLDNSLSHANCDYTHDPVVAELTGRWAIPVVRSGGLTSMPIKR